MSYEENLQAEAHLWGTVAEEQAQKTPPDWRYRRRLRYNLLTYAPQVDALLTHIQPGMRCLEAGCSSGEVALAMAQRGAHVTGMDISEQALNVARRYYQDIQDTVPGTVQYQVTDLNALELDANHYDVIVVKGTLHHLINLPEIVDTLHHALKPGGLLWISDEIGNVNTSTALFSAALMFILPTEVSYAEKFAGLRRFGLRSTSRIKASMEAEGLSPFEGAGREHDWLELVKAQFQIEKTHAYPAVTAYLAQQVNMPDAIALPILRFIKFVDNALLAPGILKSTGIVVYARK